MLNYLKLITISTGVALASPAHASDKFWQTYADIGAIGIPVAAGAITLVRDDRDGLWQLAKTGGSAFLVTEVLKYSIDSTRPNGENHSFPSGHTSTAFSGAGYAVFNEGVQPALVEIVCQRRIGERRGCQGNAA